MQYLVCLATKYSVQHSEAPIHRAILRQQQRFLPTLDKRVMPLAGYAKQRKSYLPSCPLEQLQEHELGRE